MDMEKVRLLEFCPTFQSHKKSYETCCRSNEGGCRLFNARETFHNPTEVQIRNADSVVLNSGDTIYNKYCEGFDATLRGRDADFLKLYTAFTAQ